MLILFDAVSFDATPSFAFCATIRKKTADPWTETRAFVFIAVTSKNIRNEYGWWDEREHLTTFLWPHNCFKSLNHGDEMKTISRSRSFWKCFPREWKYFYLSQNWKQRNIIYPHLGCKMSKINWEKKIAWFGKENYPIQFLLMPNLHYKVADAPCARHPGFHMTCGRADAVRPQTQKTVRGDNHPLLLVFCGKLEPSGQTTR